MKQVLTQFTLLCLACLLFTQLSHAQDLKTDRSAVFTYTFLLNDQIAQKLDTYEPTTKREKEQWGKFSIQLDTQLETMAYEKLTTKMAEAGINLLPKTALEGAVEFSTNGYPMVLFAKKKIKKISSKDLTDYYVALNVVCGAALDLGGSILSGKSVKPEVRVVIKIFNSKGAVVQKVEGDIKADKPIKSIDFAGKKFDRLDKDMVEPLIEYIEPTLEKAIDYAIGELKL